MTPFDSRSILARALRTDRAAFRAARVAYGAVAVEAVVDADWWTPVSAFHLLAGSERNAFLLESVERGERLGRYSFLGRRPFLVLRGRDGRVVSERPGRDARVEPGSPPEVIRRALARCRAPRVDCAPPFRCGAVGGFGYDAVRWMERLPDPPAAAAAEDELTLLFLRETVAFDHLTRRLHLVVCVETDEAEDADRAWDAALEDLAGMLEALHRPLAPALPVPAGRAAGAGTATLDRAAFVERVERAKAWIRSGDIFQVVLSRGATVPCAAGDLALYRALRSVNPSPYMFLLRLDGWSAVGSSPEPLLRVEGDRMTYRPIAGTIPRSGDAEEDRRRAERLLADPKERAEHVMLVDLGRNDLGRCAVPGSVRVDELMTVERYSHVMHIVSGLSAELRPERDALDALLACFPAGTVTGAPKVRAMEIIDALEPARRGLYAGAVGYLDFAGNLDTCIALRTMIVRDGTVSVQAGAGIVADSDPGREFEETEHKARALLEAVRRAEEGTT